MADLVTDTHGLIWYLQNDPRLSPAASQAFDECDQGDITIFVPVICLVEIVYLEEKGRIPTGLKSQLDSVLASGASGLAIADLTQEVVIAMQQIPRVAVPDMPDRIIAATAVALGLSLISRDHKIQSSSVTTIW